MAAVAGFCGLAMLGMLALNGLLMWHSRRSFLAALLGPQLREMVSDAPTGESNVIALASRRTGVASTVSPVRARPLRLAA